VQSFIAFVHCRGGAGIRPVRGICKWTAIFKINSAPKNLLGYQYD
jgi:hypothetical protein